MDAPIPSLFLFPFEIECAHSLWHILNLFKSKRTSSTLSQNPPLKEESKK